MQWQPDRPKALFLKTAKVSISLVTNSPKAGVELDYTLSVEGEPESMPLDRACHAERKSKNEKWDTANTAPAGKYRPLQAGQYRIICSLTYKDQSVVREISKSFMVEQGLHRLAAEEEIYVGENIDVTIHGDTSAQEEYTWSVEDSQGNTMAELIGDKRTRKPPYYL